MSTKPIFLTYVSLPFDVYVKNPRLVDTGLYWDLRSQEEPGPYKGSDYDNDMSVSLVEENGAPGGNHRPD